jgi:hypothetical protein
MAQRIIVQDGNVVYATSDPTQEINFGINGQMNVTKQLSVGDNPFADGLITTPIGAGLLISTGVGGGNLSLQPTGSLIFGNVSWPDGTVTPGPGTFLGSSALNTLQFYSFYLSPPAGSDTLTQIQLNAAYPTAQPGQYVAGPTVVYQCVNIGIWRTLGNSPIFGTVTSVDVSGGTTGLTTSGGPVTISGTITLAGTLAIANGGTGQTTANTAFNALAPTQTGNSGKILTTDGTNTSWSIETDKTVPYYIPTGETYTVAINKQALFNMPIDIVGTLVVDGFLLEV